MRIANVMFGRGLGGIEQAFLDMNEALLLAGHEVLAVTHPLAEINPQITGNVEHHTVANHGNWDIFASQKLRKIYTKWQPAAIISHGNRALNLNHRAKGSALNIGVTHNYKLQHFNKLDAVFATTGDLEALTKRKSPQIKRIAKIPNMIRLPEQVPPGDNAVPVIGAMGRFVPKKGMHLLLEAMQRLAEQDVRCKLIIGGGGAEERNLKNQAKKLGIADRVEFIGWVEDKTAFFTQIDVFCLPSTHEPFGIVLLEAMAYGRPVVGFATEGPSDIVRGTEVLLVPLEDVGTLASSLEVVLADADRQRAMVESARKLVETEYALPVVSQKIDSALKGWLEA